MTTQIPWPDAQLIGKRLDEFRDTPVRPLRRERVAADMAWFDEHCDGSRRSAAQMRRLVPGGAQHNLALTHPVPLEIVHAAGAFLRDVDGNQYIDLVQAGGATLLGTNHGPINAKVAEALASTGPATGLFHPYELKLAKLVHDVVPSVEMFRMFGSGTEAVMAALRISRLFTGKTHVVKVGGGYHGWSDQVLLGVRVPGSGAFAAGGVPHGVYAATHEVWPGDLDALADLMARLESAGGVAAVLVEPLGPESGSWPLSPEYHHHVRELCDRFGALLVYDEVVSGFRLGLGGAQALIGVTPDVTVFGKCIAGGYPGAGAVGGRQDVMAAMGGGLTDLSRGAFVGGTLAASAVSCIAGYYTIIEIERTDAAAVAARAGDRLRRGLERIVAAYNLPYVVYNFGSIVHLNSTGVLTVDLRRPESAASVPARAVALQEFSTAFAAEGLVTIAGSRLLTSAAFSDEIVDDVLARFDRVLADAQ